MNKKVLKNLILIVVTLFVISLIFWWITNAGKGEFFNSNKLIDTNTINKSEENIQLDSENINDEDILEDVNYETKSLLKDCIEHTINYEEDVYSEENLSDEEIRFFNYMKNLHFQRKANRGFWKEELLELKTIKSSSGNYTDTIKVSISSAGVLKLQIDNQQFANAYSENYVGICNNAIDFVIGEKYGRTPHYIYVLREDGTITEIKINTSIEITHNYKDLAYITQIQKQSDEEKEFVFIDAFGEQYYSN